MDNRKLYRKNSNGGNTGKLLVTMRRILSGAAARTGSLMEERNKKYKKKYRKIEVINIESHIWKQEQDNKLI